MNEIARHTLIQCADRLAADLINDRHALQQQEEIVSRYRERIARAEADLAALREAAEADLVTS